MSKGAGGGPGGASGYPAAPVGDYCSVGGRRLWRYRAGSGEATVVFLPGAGTVGLDYYNVHTEVARFSTAVTYDRAGTGWSDRVPMPRSLRAVTDELHGLLAVSALPGPYLFVGHSLGGLYARHYATRFPGEVSGLVLIDPAHEDYNAFMPAELAQHTGQSSEVVVPDELPEELLSFYRGLFEAEVETWPSALSAPLVEAHLSPEWFGAGFLEASNLGAIYAEANDAGPLPALPTIVLCSTGLDGFRLAVSGGQSEELLQAEIDGRRRLYESLATSVPRGEVRTVDGVGHVTLHLRRPDVVVQAVRDLLG
jgi:pimeloyl-ACP methyl ester carboxylesterase